MGKRLMPLTKNIPKPMVNIDNKPILYHVMSTFSKYGIKDFIIALGYKSEIIKDYFINFKERNSNFKIIQADDLQKLNVDTVIKELQKRLN